MLVQGDEHRLDHLVRSPHLAEKLVAVADAGSLADDLDALAGPHEEGIVLLLEAAEERREWHRDRPGELYQCPEARGGLGVLDLRQHALRYARPLGELLDGEAELVAVLPHTLSDDPPDSRVEGVLTRRRVAGSGAHLGALVMPIAPFAPGPGRRPPNYRLLGALTDHRARPFSAGRPRTGRSLGLAAARESIQTALPGSRRCVPHGLCGHATHRLHGHPIDDSGRRDEQRDSLPSALD